MKRYIQKIDRSIPLLSGILITGFWIRIQGFLYGTFAFTYDVGRDMLAILQMLTTHKPLLIGATTGLHGIFYGPTWYYLLLPFFILFQGDPRGIVMVMVMSGVLTVLLGYLLGKEISGKALGLIFALLISLSQILIAISAQIWNPNFIPLFVVLVLFLILGKFNKTKRLPLQFLVIGFILGIILDLEIVFGILFFTLISIYLLMNEKVSRSLKYIIILMAGFAIVQLPRIFFELRHDFLMTRTLFGAVTTDSNSQLLTPVPQISKIFILLFKVWTDTVAAQTTAFGIISGILVIFLIIVSYKKINLIEKKAVIFCVTALFVYLIGLGFFNHDIESHYYIGLPVIFLFIVSLAIYFSFKYIKIPVLGVIFLLIFFIYGVNQFGILATFQKSFWIGDASVYRNQLDVVDFIYKDAKGKEFNSITYTPPIFDYPYQYLFKWYGKKVYGYEPSQTKQTLFYLIIEEDRQFPVRQRDWLELRKNDGKIIYEKIFKGQIKLQKRIH